MKRAIALAAICVLGACGSDRVGTPQEQREEAGSELEGVPLREDEAPDGLELSDRGTGPVVSLRQVLPPRSAFPNIPPVPAALSEAFRGGYEVVYLRTEGNGAEGPTSAGSTAIRFSAPDAAGAFLGFFREVQVGAGRGPERTEVPVSALGDRAFGWHLAEPGAESSTVVWGSGNLVLSVSLGGPIGSATPERALTLARRMSGRL